MRNIKQYLFLISELSAQEVGRDSLRKTEEMAGQAEKGDMAFLIGDLQPLSRAGLSPLPHRGSMEVLHQGTDRGQSCLSRRLYPVIGLHREGPGVEGQMERRRYLGGHGARAEAHDHENDEKEEAAAWEPAQKCHGHSTYSYSAFCARRS